MTTGQMPIKISFQAECFLLTIFYWAFISTGMLPVPMVVSQMAFLKYFFTQVTAIRRLLSRNALDGKNNLYLSYMRKAG